MSYSQTNRIKTGAIKLESGLGILFLVGFGLLAAVMIVKVGLMAGFLLLGLPFVIGLLSYLWIDPKAGIWLSLIMGFLISGLSRYIVAPWGLTIDIFLFLSLLFSLINSSIKIDWKRTKNDITIFSLVWMGYLIFEILNPHGNGLVAWFYAMRGIGFYQMLSVPMIYLFLREEKHFYTFLNILIILSLAGTAWGFKQQLLGVDAAEYRWLWDENHHEEHVLHGVLRVFSFYSDAGQFGASQAMMALLTGILAVSPLPTFKRILFGILAIVFFLGFAISGTRGALAVPLFGGIAYLITTKNFKVLGVGFSAMILVFVILKYTFLFQGVEQVRRMRTALDPNNRSLEVRLENQITFGKYLADKPFGGGVGTAGFWGARFNPDSLMANTATDSWFVKIWAETGFFGLLIHISFLGYVIGKGGAVCMGLTSPKKKSYAMALYASIVGVIFSSYGNQVFGQMPTGMIMNLAIPFLFLIPHWPEEKK
ncbi:O-antigen ligase domain-containing protein [Algoriphagus kandeliae]|uniref:O-antigen ligase domain-containing protein n=1 Tax=Algoriphagus kandeliae TaxID=2562278 RepID=A0A4Y9QTZ8_9BACT|nr:O-antigen ligase family protein [Algoriphagus kandeliae]TFV95587.1 O-antigen ligase domain-containing protein [Algoriphagus kandeliae]